MIYCVAIAYCCLWIPWRVDYHASAAVSRPMSYRAGYGWIWAGPEHDPSYANPDFPLIGLRIVAVTAVGGVLLLILSLKPSTH